MAVGAFQFASITVTIAFTLNGAEIGPPRDAVGVTGTKRLMFVKPEFVSKSMRLYWALYRTQSSPRSDGLDFCTLTV